MMRSMQSAVTGLRAQQTAMDVIGNNIANVNTVGFKASLAEFSDLFYQTLNSGNETVAPSQVGYGAQMSNVSKNMTSVGAQTTDNPTDLYLDGEGFFGVTADPNGKTPQYFTRVGNFSFNTQGYLVDKATGFYVMGYDASAVAPNPKMSPIKINTNTIAGSPTTYTNVIKLVPTGGGAAIDIDDSGTFAGLTDVSINSDGSITAKVNNTTGKLYIGGTHGSAGADGQKLQIGLSTFLNSSGLAQVGNNFYVATESSGAANETTPGTNNNTQIRTGELEMSNVDVAKEFTNMIQTQRGFQANSRIITVSDSMLEELVNLKRS